MSVFPLIPVLLAGVLLFQEVQPAPQQPPTTAAEPVTEAPIEWVCPMDRDIRMKGPGKCPRCGMTLVPGIPDFVEYIVKVRTNPRAIRPGRETELSFEMLDPKTRKRVTEFQIVHEKLCHLFLVSRDLKSFNHIHPVLGKDGIFRLPWTFTEPGMYRVLNDYYPKGGTPQLTTNTIFVQGTPPVGEGPPKLAVDMSEQKSANTSAKLTLDPPQPIAGFKTLMFFDLTPGDGLEKYIGAWGHMLAASEDLVDMIHNHPFLANGGPHVQFNMIFPRPGIYRVWVQFQRKGVVNTFAFNVPVVELK
ncbi:MAG TPA: heavy metal-binding domain-containing protein [Bryobacteraceae bacterium]|jgi:hypothetical protein